MKVLFCHDGPLRKDEEHNYYGTAHNDDTFKRYYNIADKLEVLIRLSTVTKNEAEQKLSRISVSPFEVVECPNLSSLKGLLNKKKAQEIITEEVVSADYIVARLPSFIGSFAIDAAKKHKKPYLVEVVACPWDAFWNHSLSGKIVAPYMYFLTKKRISNAEYVLYVTKEFLQRRYPTNGQSIACSDVNLNHFDDNIINERIKKIEMKKENEKIVIGTTAAVNVKYKGQQFVIKAIGRLKEMGYDNFEYHLVGGGNQKYLKKIAEKYNVSDRVLFLGSMTHPKVYEWLKNIDLYVQPSRQEGLPRALIEAMSCGLPAIGTNIAGIPELLDQKLLFSNGRSNVKELIRLLLSLKKEDLKQQAIRNYNVAKEYDKEVIEHRRNSFFNKAFKNAE